MTAIIPDFICVKFCVKYDSITTAQRDNKTGFCVFGGTWDPHLSLHRPHTRPHAPLDTPRATSDAQTVPAAHSRHQVCADLLPRLVRHILRSANYTWQLFTWGERVDTALLWPVVAQPGCRHSGRSQGTVRHWVHISGVDCSGDHIVFHNRSSFDCLSFIIDYLLIVIHFVFAAVSETKNTDHFCRR